EAPWSFPQVLEWTQTLLDTAVDIVADTSGAAAGSGAPCPCSDSEPACSAQIVVLLCSGLIEDLHPPAQARTAGHVGKVAIGNFHRIPGAADVVADRRGALGIDALWVGGRPRLLTSCGAALDLPGTPVATVARP